MKLKKVLAVILAVAMIICALPTGALNFTASAATTLNGVTLSYEINNGEATITGCDKSISGDVILPSTLDGYPVVGIASYAFCFCSKIKSITIPDGIKNLGEWTFLECTGLESVIIPDSVESIGLSLFSSCSGLKSIIIPDSVESIGEQAFYNCSSLESITIPDRVKSLGNWAFERCSSLAEIILPGSLKSIGGSAFYNCNSLENVYYCGTAEEWDEIFINANNSALKKATKNYHRFCEWITVKGYSCTHESGKYRICEVCGEYETAAIGHNYINGICTNCGMISEGLLTYTVSDGKATITGCNDFIIGDVTIPTTLGGYPVVGIDSSAFAYNRITGVIIPDCVEYIGSHAFEESDSLKSVTIGNGVTSIGYGAFEYCENLESVTIGNSVKCIEFDAFLCCLNLKSINIPKSLERVKERAFSGCEKLSDVYIEDVVAWSKIDFSANLFESRPTDNSKNVYLNNLLLTDLYIPDGTQFINKSQYTGFGSLKNVFIPKSVSYVIYNAFENCDNIENIYFEGSAEQWSKVEIMSNNFSKDVTVHFGCTKIPGYMSGLTLSKLPNKTKYIEYREALDLTGGVITAHYDGGATRDIDLSTLPVIGFDNSVCGKQTLTVKYGNYNLQFEVEVISSLSLTVFDILKLPTKRIYKLGDSLDLAGGKLAVNYPEDKHEIIDITPDMVSGYDSSKLGCQTITVMYDGYKAEFFVNVCKSGDVDGNGTVNATDITILRTGLNNPDIAEAMQSICDVNSDGRISIHDLVGIKKMLVSINS